MVINDTIHVVYITCVPVVINDAIHVVYITCVPVVINDTIHVVYITCVPVVINDTIHVVYITCDFSMVTGAIQFHTIINIDDFNNIITVNLCAKYLNNMLLYR